MNAIPAVILAGGQARRMGGGDKGLLMMQGQSLLQRVITRLAPQVGAMALNANGDPARFADFGLPVISDSFTGFAGPLAGILAALDWANDIGADQVITVAADTPFFPHDLVAGLAAGISDTGAKIALAATLDPVKGVMRQPTFGLWPVELRDDLRGALASGTRKVVQWSDQHQSTHALFKNHKFDPFFNINTVADMDMARIILAGGEV